MRKGEFNWFWATMIGTPVLMVITKCARMDAKERHEIQMRVKHRSDFWAKGNTFTTTVRDAIHRHLAATTDPMMGK